MTTQNKRKDDELEVWVMVGGFFTLGLLCVDFFYSSVNQMALIARIAIWAGHGLLSLGWIMSIAKWKDPNYDYIRQGVVALCAILLFIIAIHHSTSTEDKQVIEDSEKNKASGYVEPSIKFRLYELSRKETAEQAFYNNIICPDNKCAVYFKYKPESL